MTNPCEEHGAFPNCIRGLPSMPFWYFGGGGGDAAAATCEVGALYDFGNPGVSGFLGEGLGWE